MPDDEDLDLDDYLRECPIHQVPVCQACGFCHLCEEAKEDDETDSS